MGCSSAPILSDQGHRETWPGDRCAPSMSLIPSFSPASWSPPSACYAGAPCQACVLPSPRLVAPGARCTHLPSPTTSNQRQPTRRSIPARPPPLPSSGGRSSPPPACQPAPGPDSLSSPGLSHRLTLARPCPSPFRAGSQPPVTLELCPSPPHPHPTSFLLLPPPPLRWPLTQGLGEALPWGSRLPWLWDLLSITVNSASPLPERSG